MCTYIYSVSCSIIAEIFMIFGYTNNAWIVLYNDDKQFQRGLNDDCFKSDGIRCQAWHTYSNSNSSSFPEPFNVITPPNAAMLIALNLARGALFIQFTWFMACVICCCNANAERFAKKHQRSLLQYCALAAFCFALLFFIIVVAYFTDDIMETVPKDYHRTLGSGFWLFIAGGAPLYLLSVFLVYREDLSLYIQKRQSHEPLPRHELTNLPS